MSYKTLSSDKVSDIVNRMGIYMPTQELEAFVNTMDDVAGANKDEVEDLVQRAEASASGAQQDADAAFASAQVAANSANKAKDSADQAEQARLLGTNIGYATKALMDADLARPEGTLALVTNDPLPANNGTYRWSGSTWVLSADRVTGLESETANYRAAGDPIIPLAPMGFAWTIVDLNGIAAAGILDDGTFTAAAAEFPVANLGELRHGSDSQFGNAPSGFAWAVLDPAGFVGLGLRTDGTLVATRIEAQAVNGVAVVPQPPRNGTFHAEINHVISYGQSLSIGNGAEPIQTISQPYDNLMFNAGVRAFDGAGTAASNRATLIPLVEALTPGTGNFETPAGFASSKIKRLIAAENGLSHADHSYQILASASGVSNTAIASLSKPSTGYSLLLDDITYGYAAAQAQGKSYNVPAVFFSQGERDYENGTTRAAYLAALNSLYASIDADAKAVSGQANDVVLIAYQCVIYSHSPATVALAQTDAAKANPNIVIACPSYCVEHLAPTNVHLTGAGSAHLGAYYAIAYKRTVIDGELFTPLQIAHASAQGAVISLRFDVPAGPLAFDTVQLPAKANHGFSLVDSGGGALGITSVTITGPNTVKVVANDVIASGARIRYGYDNGGNLRDSQGDYIQADLPGGQRRMDNWCVAFEEQL